MNTRSMYVCFLKKPYDHPANPNIVMQPHWANDLGLRIPGLRQRRLWRTSWATIGPELLLPVEISGGGSQAAESRGGWRDGQDLSLSPCPLFFLLALTGMLRTPFFSFSRGVGPGSFVQRQLVNLTRQTCAAEVTVLKFPCRVWLPDASGVYFSGCCYRVRGT